MAYKNLLSIDALKTASGRTDEKKNLSDDITLINTQNSAVAFAQQIMDFVYDANGNATATKNQAQMNADILAKLATIETTQTTGLQYRGALNIAISTYTTTNGVVGLTAKVGDVFVVNSVTSAFTAKYKVGDIVIVKTAITASTFDASNQSAITTALNNSTYWDIVQGNLTNEDQLVTAATAATAADLVAVSNAANRALKYVSKATIVSGGTSGLGFEGTYNSSSNKIVTKSAMTSAINTAVDGITLTPIDDATINALS